MVWGLKINKVNAMVKTQSIGLTKNKKQNLMKKLGPKKRFLSVEEREQKILWRVNPNVYRKLK